MLKYDESRLLKFEKYYSVKFPKEYKEFLKNYVEEKSYIFGDERVLEKFLSFIEDYEEKGECDIPVITTQLVERLTKNPDSSSIELVPIGSIFSGDYICFDFTNNKENPEVCIWYHDASDEFSPFTLKVANNFVEFLGELNELKK